MTFVTRGRRKLAARHGIEITRPIGDTVADG
jgi:hypothetical protein